MLLKMFRNLYACGIAKKTQKENYYYSYYNTSLFLFQKIIKHEFISVMYFHCIVMYLYFYDSVNIRLSFQKSGQTSSLANFRITAVIIQVLTEICVEVHKMG